MLVLENNAIEYGIPNAFLFNLILTSINLIFVVSGLNLNTKMEHKQLSRIIVHYVIVIQRTTQSSAVNGTTAIGCTLAQRRVAAIHPLSVCMGMAATSPCCS